ncbi:hypothetical protein [Burkholderia cepacia]|uniref:hypothetical protein n=1 Tax=Burkholderia cepacia TaxID=292 RepID=UPI00398EA1DE
MRILAQLGKRPFTMRNVTETVFGQIEPDQITLNTATTLGLKAAFEDFESDGQDLRDFEVRDYTTKASNDEGSDGKDVIGATFGARVLPGQRGLGNISKQGKSINYVISPESGEILNIHLTR